MRRVLARIVPWLVVALLLAGGAGAAPRPRPGPVAAIVMDARTGQVLYARDVHRRWAPASTTKMVTALLTLERLSADLLVTIGPRTAAQRGGASIGLQTGERWRIEDLLLAMMLRSANDAAIAAAEATAGSVERFVALMNDRARQLGARQTRFVSPHGLDAPGQYSTAYDLAVIARGALQNPRFAALVRRPSWTLAREGRPPQTYTNTNRLLGRYPGADGVKTGWTAASGESLVASATRDGWQLIAVVLHSRGLYADVEQLLDYGFHGFLPLRLVTRGEVLATVPVGAARTWLPAVAPADVHVVVRKGAVVTPVVRLRRDLRPPIQAGVPVGAVEFRSGERVVARSVLVAGRAVAR